MMGRLEGRVPRHQTALLSQASCKQFKFKSQKHDYDTDEDDAYVIDPFVHVGNFTSAKLCDNFPLQDEVSAVYLHTYIMHHSKAICLFALVDHLWRKV